MKVFVKLDVWSVIMFCLQSVFYCYTLTGTFPQCFGGKCSLNLLIFHKLIVPQCSIITVTHQYIFDQNTTVFQHDQVFLIY